MAVIESVASPGTIAEVGATTQSPLHATIKPIPWGALGHYRVTHRFVLVNNQAANSRLFEVRNTHASNLIVPTRLLIKWISSSAHTAFIEDSLDLFKLTSFSVVDSANNVALTPSKKRASMAATSAVVQGVTVAGAATGMTGGTLTKDTSSFGQVPAILAQAAMAAADTASRFAQVNDMLDDVNGTHPFVFVQNEGFEIENRVLLGAAAGSSVYIDFSFAEVTAY